MSVYAKLNKARLALQSMPLKKSGHNKFAGYQYFELGDFLPQVQQIFDNIGLCGVVSFGNDIAELRIINLDDKNDVHVITSPMSEAALKGCHPVQNLGAVQTYIRRYLWVTALEIVEHDALDATTKKGTITPNDGAGDDLSQDQRNKVADMSIAIKDAFEADDVPTAYGMFKELNNDEKRYLWSMLDSGIRSKLKSYGKEQ